MTPDQISQLYQVLKMAICPNCDGSGDIPHQISEKRYVTRDMAIDGGDLALEGSLYSDDKWELEQCQWCAEREQALALLPCKRCGGMNGKHKQVDDLQAGNSNMLTKMQCPLDNPP